VLQILAAVISAADHVTSGELVLLISMDHRDDTWAKFKLPLSSSKRLM
jgi:hypothetical protein